jgi:hypothetical protein
MKDVFVSYDNEDRAIAQRLAMGLEASGISVWWDREIQVGSEWDKAIEEALTAAKCVVVLWTGHAKQSRWVRAEARAALKQEKVVPVMLEADAIPLAFTGIQALRFLGWEGEAGSKEYDMLLGVIRSKLAGKPIVLPVGAATKASCLGKVAAVVGLKTLAGLVLAVLLMASSFWRIDADLAIQVQTGRIEFSVNPGLDQKRLTDSLLFAKLSLQHVGQLSFSPDQLFVANPDELDWETDTYPPKAWLALPSNGRKWQFQAPQSGMNPMVTLESRDRKEPHVGKLDAIVLSQPATVTLEVTDKNTMTLAIRTEKGAQRIVVSGLENIEIVEEGLKLEQATHLSFSQDQELTYRALFKKSSGTITVEGNDTTFIVVMNPAQSAETTLFSKTVLPLTSVDVSWQDPKTGERTIHKKFQGTVQYPSLPDLPKIAFQAPMSLTIEDLDRFEITSIRLDPVTHAFLVDMQGTAGYVKTGTRNNPRDLRPTLFDVILFHPALVPLRNLIGL